MLVVEKARRSIALLTLLNIILQIIIINQLVSPYTPTQSHHHNIITPHYNPNHTIISILSTQVMDYSHQIE